MFLLEAVYLKQFNSLQVMAYLSKSKTGCVFHISGVGSSGKVVAVRVHFSSRCGARARAPS